MLLQLIIGLVWLRAVFLRAPVIGSKIADELFPSQNPLGEVVRIGDFRMRVIGVLEQRGQQVGLDMDDIVIVPVATAMRIFNRSSLFRIR